MPVWITSDPRTMSTFYFVDPKTSWPSKWGILVVKEDPLVLFSDGIGHLQQVAKLSQFIPTKTFYASSTIQVYPIRCTLSERPNTIIKSHNKKASNTFPKFLWANIMDYFKQVTSWHVDKFFKVKLLQVLSKECMKMIIHNFMQKIKHVAWSSPPLSHMEMLETQPIIELMNCTFGNNPWIIPPRSNYNISNIHFFQRCCILIFET
jgi:hypothetical protein